MKFQRPGSGAAISSRVNLLPFSPLSSYGLQGDSLRSSWPAPSSQSGRSGSYSGDTVAAQRKGEKGFRMIVIVLLLCDGKVVEVFGIGANWHHKVAT
jgi:hypothetical protein